MSQNPCSNRVYPVETNPCTCLHGVITFHHADVLLYLIKCSVFVSQAPTYLSVVGLIPGPEIHFKKKNVEEKMQTAAEEAESSSWLCRIELGHRHCIQLG
jgi:hypothetical protein